MKQLIEEQKKGIYNIIAKLDNGTHSSNQLQGTDEALWNWHKQSLNQFIDGLITNEQEYVDIINKNDNGTKFEEGYRDAKENSISHLKKLKEQLN